jgi:hypothetical protein
LALRSPCGRQGGDLGEPMVEFQSKYEGVRTGRENFASSSLRSSLKAGVNSCPSLKRE